MSTQSNVRVTYDLRHGAAWITMQEPERRNPLGREMVAQLRSAVARAYADTWARCIVIAGAGPVFCAGADLRQYLEAADEQAVMDDGARLYDLLDDLASCPKPVIVRVQRGAFGGAIGIICAADIVIAGEGARFSLSEAKLGLVPAVIGPAVVRSLGRRHALALMLRAEPIGSAEALRVGMVQQVVPDDDLDAAVTACTLALSTNAPGSMRDAKQMVIGLGEHGRTPLDIRADAVRLAARRRVDPEGQEGMAAFLEKRKPNWAEQVHE